MTDIELIHGDSLQALKGYGDNYFDWAIVDPPYGIDDKLYRSSHGKNKNTAIAKFYNEKRWDIAPDKEYFLELKRVSKNQIIWGGNYFTDNLPQSRGWICWDKKRPAGNSFSDFELAYISKDTMPKMFRYSAQGGFVAKPDDRYKIHPTQKPVDLYRFCLEHYTNEGDLILDTHLGSGSIAIACHQMKRKLIAYEIDAEYYEKACKRFKEQTAQQALW